MISNENLVFRHTKYSNSPNVEQSKNFEGISQEGEDLARQKALELAKSIERLPANSVIFAGGVSNLVRTRSTMKVYVDVLSEYFKDRQDVMFVSEEDIRDLSKESGPSKTAKTITENVRDAQVKIIIDLPLFIKQFSDPNWRSYFRKVNPMKPNIDVVRDWLKDQGIIDGEQIGPNPKQVAENYLEGQKRIKNFASKFFPNRPIITANVGHSAEIDAFLTYLANNGEVSFENFEKFGGNEIQETESALIRSLPDNKIQLQYRDCEYIFEAK
jgi:hypothetical protein